VRAGLLERAEPDDTVPTTWVGEDGTTVLLNVSDEAVTVQGPGGTDRALRVRGCAP
jgi:hypothetical protein